MKRSTGLLSLLPLLTLGCIADPGTSADDASRSDAYSTGRGDPRDMPDDPRSRPEPGERDRCPEANACFERLAECRVAGRDCSELAFECERHQQACQPPVDPAVACREQIAACVERYNQCQQTPESDCTEVREHCAQIVERCRPPEPPPRPCPEAEACYERLRECRISGRDCTDLAFECERHQQACQPPVDPAVACREQIAACAERYNQCAQDPRADCSDVRAHCAQIVERCQPPVPPQRPCPEVEACYERLQECRISGRDCTDLGLECERYQQACQPPVDPAVACREQIAACAERYNQCTQDPRADCSDVRAACAQLAERCQP